jgi:hypothetical protein
MRPEPGVRPPGFPPIKAGGAQAATVMSIAAGDVVLDRRTEWASVVTYRSRQNLRNHHEHAAITEIARRLAALHGARYEGDFEPDRGLTGKTYFVPDETLIADTAGKLGIAGERDLFGGVVPFEFVATKAITHALAEQASVVPEGWSAVLGARIQDSTLRGFTAFSERDIVGAAADLLRAGPIRIKPVRAKGGRGQSVVSNTAELRTALDKMDFSELAKFGLVLEENLDNVKTYSVGFVSCGDLSFCYHGTQTLTPNNEGRQVYGGSNLVVARGGSDCLLRQPMEFRERIAVEQAVRYDAAARACYPKLFASRRNYDILQGIDAQGGRRSGVLEQSWRVGGASPAEITAFEAFHADPELTTVHACCVERYGKDVKVPHGAHIYFEGIDEKVGPMVKYACLLR